MRILTKEETSQALDDNGESEEGCKAIESTVKELAEMNARTGCGICGNTTFKALNDSGFGERKCRGWHDGSNNEVVGTFHIEADESEGDNIDKIATLAGGSLRHNGQSMWAGFEEIE